MPPRALRACIVVAATAAIVGCGTRAPKSAQNAAPAAGYHVIATHPIGGDGGWDLLTVDPQARRLFIARSDRVTVVDADSGKVIGEIPGSGVHGVAIVPETNRGFITNGKDDSVTLFDTRTLAVVGHAKTGPKPDAIAYDRASKRVFVCDNGGTSLTVLAADDGKVVATIDVGGAPEQVAVDGKGRLYTNLEDQDGVGVVDTLALKVVARWPLAPGQGPSGIAVDAEHHRVFSACRGSRTIQVLDAASGKVIASPPIGGGADGAAFDPASGNVFSPNGDGTLTVIHEDGPAVFRVVETVTTKPYARTIAFDEKTRRLYLVTADPKPSPDGAATKSRPGFLPGSFVVLVVGR